MEFLCRKALREDQPRFGLHHFAQEILEILEQDGLKQENGG